VSGKKTNFLLIYNESKGIHRDYINDNLLNSFTFSYPPKITFLFLSFFVYLIFAYTIQYQQNKGVMT